jgi:hypothetical protein
MCRSRRLIDSVLLMDYKFVTLSLFMNVIIPMPVWWLAEQLFRSGFLYRHSDVLSSCVLFFV